MESLASKEVATIFNFSANLAQHIKVPHRLNKISIYVPPVTPSGMIVTIIYYIAEMMEMINMSIAGVSVCLMFGVLLVVGDERRVLRP